MVMKEATETESERMHKEKGKEKMIRSAKNVMDKELKRKDGSVTFYHL